MIHKFLKMVALVGVVSVLTVPMVGVANKPVPLNLGNCTSSAGIVFNMSLSSVVLKGGDFVTCTDRGGKLITPNHSVSSMVSGTYQGNILMLTYRSPAPSPYNVNVIWYIKCTSGNWKLTRDGGAECPLS